MTGDHEVAGLGEYLAVVRRRRWLVLQALVLVPAAAVALSLRQDPSYRATAEVLLTRPSASLALSGTSDAVSAQIAERHARTQAEIATSPELVARVIRGTNSDLDVAEFLERADVTARRDVDVLQFRFTAPDAADAARIATAYATQFVRFSPELDADAIERARADVEDRLRALRAAGARTSALYASLVDKEQQLRTLAAVQPASALLLRAARDAEPVTMGPLARGLLGLAVGLVLGLALAFLREALDTRVRSVDEVVERLCLPLLGRLPEPARRLRSRDQLVMIADPGGVEAEAFRQLRTSLELMRLERQAKTIMITSAAEGEGKSTSAANLAIALARGGKQVVLVDLDLRRAGQKRFFPLQAHPGITEVALGTATLDEALVRVAALDHAPSVVSGNGARGGAPGSLDVLAAGAMPPDPGEFVGTLALARVLDEVRGRADVVLVDAAPLLVVGDALALTPLVDAILLVVRRDLIRRPVLKELRRVLETVPAQKLGFVLTAATREDAYTGGVAYEGGYFPAELPVPTLTAVDRGREELSA